MTFSFDVHRLIMIVTVNWPDTKKIPGLFKTKHALKIVTTQWSWCWLIPTKEVISKYSFSRPKFGFLYFFNLQKTKINDKQNIWQLVFDTGFLTGISCSPSWAWPQISIIKQVSKTNCLILCMYGWIFS